MQMRESFVHKLFPASAVLRLRLPFGWYAPFIRANHTSTDFPHAYKTADITVQQYSLCVPSWAFMLAAPGPKCDRQT
jgi:hypothetical protein